MNHPNSSSRVKVSTTDAVVGSALLQPGSTAVLEFPRASAVSWRTSSFSTVGESQGRGVYYKPASYAENTYTGTGLASVSAFKLNIQMHDVTAGCAIGEV